MIFNSREQLNGNVNFEIKTDDTDKEYVETIDEENYRYDKL